MPFDARETNSNKQIFRDEDKADESVYLSV